MLQPKLQQLQEEENTNYYLLTKTPFIFNDNDEAAIIASSLLNRSVGIEIECDQSSFFDFNNFKSIKNILDVNIDSKEQRFRIPIGLSGLKVLYEICKQLKINSELNPLSGIHYHIDCTNDWLIIENNIDNLKQQEWLLEELDTWEYKGTYNKREISETITWVRIQSMFKTLEFRIGEMTFDYTLMCKRIFHLTEIVNKLIILLSNNKIIYDINSPEYIINNKIKKIEL